MATDRPLTRTQLALEARKRFVTEAGRAMVDLSGAVQDRLSALLNESATAREMHARRDAWTLYQRARGPWLDATVKVWQKALLPPSATVAVNTGSEGFQLVGTDVTENKILSSRLVIAVTDKISAQLDDLKVRIRHLEGANDLEDLDIFRPQTLILPVIEQWSAVGMPRDAWSFVHEVALTLLSDRLLAAYTQCNDYLIRHGVLPTIELKDRVKLNANKPIAKSRGGIRTPGQTGQSGPTSTFGIDSGYYGSPSGSGSLGAQGGSPRSAQHAGPSGGESGRRVDFGSHTPGGTPGGSHPASGPRPLDGGGQYRSSGGHPGYGGQGNLGQAGQQGPQSHGAPQGQPGPQGHRDAGQHAGTAYSNAHDETRMLTATTPLARARSRAQGVIGQLKRLLIGRVGEEAEVGSYQIASPALAAAVAQRPAPQPEVYGDGLTVIEDYSPAGVARVAGRLREQTTELKKKAETKGEKATIEIVALMFQAILQEDRIPPGIRVWFARLQMPVLRVALEEPDFFGTLTHPARQLIDRMGSCVMGFDASAIQGGALEGEIKRVVQVIEQYPETGKRVYQLVYEEFQKFLAKFLTEKDATKKIVGVAQQVEQKETLTIQYTIEMRNMLKDMAVRDEIREFLFKVWAEVLAVAAVRKGPQHAETLELKKSATDLVWAASAKPNRGDRARVIADLPKLLQRLRAGMALLGLPPTQQDAHIKTVSDTLADAFLSKTHAIPQAQIEAMAVRLANLEDFVSEDGMGDLPLDGESIEIMLGIDASSIDVIADGGSKPSNAMVAWAQELQLGAWFMLDHNGRVTQVQFAWRSERKHLNLFAATDGHSYLIQAGRLAAYLQAGLLLPQEEETLTVRATRDALTKLEANPERLLG
jgi:Protein of unknown function (DUF1631)